ncbi:MAG: hypothetical protein ACRD9R_03145 [Pyrinomonadaceae bacterium]
MNWQNIAVILIVIGAALYVGRRGWARVRSFAARRGQQQLALSDCGACDAGGAKQKSDTAAPIKVLVQIAPRRETTSSPRAKRAR